MEWATTHFQLWVATLQVVLRQEGLRIGLCACAHERALTTWRWVHDRFSSGLCRDGGFLVATGMTSFGSQLKHSGSRQSWLPWGATLGRDMKCMSRQWAVGAHQRARPTSCARDRTRRRCDRGVLSR